MQGPSPDTIYLADYQPFPFHIDGVALRFQLSPTATRVTSKIAFRPRATAADLRLDGEGLRLIWAKVDGRALDLTPDATGVSVPADALPNGAFTWECEVEIAPASNTALEGLYMSNGMYCTQCEAEGFRKITFYPDRPDVMARFDVRVEGDLPVLLSNGNLVAQGDGFAEWHDPWPKPAYLFALVAGDLRAHANQFTTMSGRKVALNIWVRPGDEDRCDWPMQSLIKSMAWDEKVYGREYDLDIFNIVAVDDFNMGAMENKGLNIFNSKAVLANAATATDDDFTRIEAIIAHEYFHNWTGNRITCRDWFQLCLKEGLTVYRDQQFSGDLRGHDVRRIEDVMVLRARQFREDAGPLAHPVRPESFVEINNFYTATVYEKGAELIGMLRLLVGEAGWKAGCDLYFTRHDGQACTIEDWLQVFTDATGKDLTQFARWYSQPGTPRVSIHEDWQDGTLTLSISQHLPQVAGAKSPLPLEIPISLGLIGPNGDDVLPTQVLVLTEETQTFSFAGLAARPLVSALRGFSAPVILDQTRSPAQLAFQLAHDSDAFNRWEAGRALARHALTQMIAQNAAPDADWLTAMTAVLRDDTLAPAFRALALRLPGEDDLAQSLFAAGIVPDPDRIWRARRQLAASLARHCEADLARLWDTLAPQGAFSPEAEQAGKRALRATVLGLLTRLDGGARAADAWAVADNMTDQIAALAALIEAGRAEAALAEFAQTWGHDRLVMDKWFQVQISGARPEALAETAARLTALPSFDLRNPNRFRAVFGALAAHHAGFHHDSGAAYRLLADWLIRLDALNPQTAARVSSAFDSWRRYDADRQGMVRHELARIRATPGLSRDLTEMTSRMLG